MSEPDHQYKGIHTAMRPRILVTGATGFLGAAIVKACLCDGFNVRTTGRSTNSTLALPDYAPADLLCREQIAPLLSGVDMIVHAAGLAHQFGRARHDMARFTEVNVGGTENIIRAAVHFGIQHVVLISSVAVYGRSAENEDVPCYPRGPYAESKYQAEQRAMEIAASSDLRLTVLRPATIYGEGDPGNVARLMRAIDRRRFIRIGKGDNRKSLIHRDDVASACLAVLQSRGSGISTYNISAPPCTMYEIVEGLAAALHRKIPRWHLPSGLIVGMADLSARLAGERGPFVALSSTVHKWLADDVYSAERFEATFRFRTAIDLMEGLRREVAWYRRQSGM
jgi:nucleoside-diphosphate-sugar epimerase